MKGIYFAVNHHPQQVDTAFSAKIYCMFTIDFVKHNEEVQQVWEAYLLGTPIRVPVGNFTVGPRIWLLDPTLNTEGITWEAFSNDPELMFQVQLKYRYHLQHHVIHDIEMGIPAVQWETFVECVNVMEAAWLGCELYYPDHQVTATQPRYTGDRKNAIFDRGMPAPFDGVFARVKEYYEYFLVRAIDYEFYGKPVHVGLPGPGLYTDGPLTVALDVRGEEILTDMLLDPDYYHQLMTFIVDATIRRVKAWRTYLNQDPKPQCGAFADDVIQLLSVDTYREYVLPYHQRLLDELYGGGPHMMHICGDVQRHFPTLINGLHINHFDTGFPINFTTLRDEIGEDVHINGGVHIGLLLNGAPEQVREETRRILQSGIMRGGKFIMKEANNLPPGVPQANLWAMYEATREFGRY